MFSRAEPLAKTYLPTADPSLNLLPTASSINSPLKNLCFFAMAEPSAKIICQELSHQLKRINCEGTVFNPNPGGLVANITYSISVLCLIFHNQVLPK
jgi:hypothetical protein